MNERPILFNGEMVRAILDGRKTMTRRVLKPQPDKSIMFPVVGQYFQKPCPFGVPGDRLWVRETWRPDTAWSGSSNGCIIEYRADGEKKEFEKCLSVPVSNQKWLPSIHMPRWASRITLEITNIRVERLQEITEGDAYREGCSMDRFTPDDYKNPWCDVTQPIAINNFSSLWNSINGKKHPWESKPWVWVIEFKKMKNERQAGD